MTVDQRAASAASDAQEAIDLVAQLAAHDAQIAAIEAEVAALPRLLARLAGHPALWLLLGRAGVDRPADDLSALVGQQAPPAPVGRRWPLAALGVGLFAIGVAAGALLAAV